MSEFFLNFSQYYIYLSLLSFIVIIVDLYFNRQSMQIMNVVWAMTALWAGVLALVLYFYLGRASGAKMDMKMPMPDMPKMNMEANIFKSSALSTLHCGAGCTLADIIGEFSTINMNVPIFYQWGLDYALALIFGFAFQYIAIVEMSKISFKEAITKAIKADFLSLTFWQIGMYLSMGYALFFLFKDINISKLSFAFCFLMQISMLVGFIFSYPINIALIKLKIKTAM